MIRRSPRTDDNAPEVASLQERYHITSFPTLVVVSADEDRPVVMAGYRGRALTLQSLSQAWMQTSGKGPVFRVP